MGINLSKGGNINLSKEAPGMVRALIGLGWDARATDGKDFDLDASAFMCDANGKVTQERNFVFYNNLESACGSVRHQGDNRTGAGDGDDEVIAVNLAAVPEDVDKIAVVVTIHTEGANPGPGEPTFGQVSNAFIRIVDADTQNEVARYDLTEDASTNRAIIFGEVYRHDGSWKFRAVGQGFDNGLAGMLGHYGLA